MEGVRPTRLTLLVLVLALASGCTSANESATSSATAPTTAPTSEPPPSTSPIPGPSPILPSLSGTRISLTPTANGSFLVHAVYPQTQSSCKHAHTARFSARYPGALSVKSADDGTLSLVVTLPFERYLEGIAEMPPSWPAAALQAQAIAARSYALAHIGWSGQQGAEVQQPICGTTGCQVYGGIHVPST